MIGELKVLLELMRNDPQSAARELDIMGDRLKNLAKKLRQADNHFQTWLASQGFSQLCGAGDRVMVEVYGPDGVLKQKTHT